MLQRIRQQPADAVTPLRIDEARLSDTNSELFLAALRPPCGEHKEENVHI
ncbi:hypothetical protein BH11GEM2_BH11GEM2_09340 [soil metagenome]